MARTSTSTRAVLAIALIGAAASVGSAAAKALFFTGYFQTVGPQALPANRVARYDPATGTWSALGAGVGSGDDYVRASAVYKGELYVGGFFGVAGGDTSAKYLARWNGTAWRSVGSGVDDGVVALQVHKGALFAAGNLNTAGGAAAAHVAQWDGTRWSALGAGVSDVVHALTVFENHLIVGGYFTSAGGATANRVARWDGAAWSALGSGMNNMVEALGVHDGVLYAGGYFTTASGVTANGLARWNGASWSPLATGAGVNELVRGFASFQGALIIGGWFSIAGGAYVSHVARWSGSSYSAVGAGTNAFVQSVFAHDGVLLAMGDFTSAGGVAAKYLAQYDGTAWSQYGGGVSSAVWSVSVDTMADEPGQCGGLSGGCTEPGRCELAGTVWQAQYYLDDAEDILVLDTSTFAADGAYAQNITAFPFQDCAANSVLWDGVYTQLDASALRLEYRFCTATGPGCATCEATRIDDVQTRFDDDCGAVQMLYPDEIEWRTYFRTA